jgi:hypothetical protein
MASKTSSRRFRAPPPAVAPGVRAPPTSLVTVSKQRVG